MVPRRVFFLWFVLTILLCLMVVVILLVSDFMTDRSRLGRTKFPVITEDYVVPPRLKETDERDFLVYRCTEPAHCQSWTDMQKGIVTAYVMADMMQRRFALRVTYPCEKFASIAQLHDPSVELAPELHSFASERHIILKRRSEYSMVSKLSTLDFDAAFPEAILYVTADDDYTEALSQNEKYIQRSWMLAQDLKPEELYEAVLSTLFQRPTPVRYSMQVLHQIKSCAHVLAGQNYRVMSPDDETLLAMLQVLEDRAPNSYVYISTNSLQVERVAKDALPSALLVLRGREHWDLSNDQGGVCDALEEDIIDQEVLKRCRHLVINYSESGFLVAKLSHMRQGLELICMSDELFPCDADNAEQLLLEA